MKYRIMSICVICLAFLLCASGAAFGQGTDLGTIRGAVTDSTGAVIPAATVTVTDALTNTARETRTNNIFNHPLLSPNADAGGGGGTFALLGDFNLRVDQSVGSTGKLLPIDPADVTLNPDFGRLISSFSQEGIDNKRTVRLRLRITF